MEQPELHMVEQNSPEWLRLRQGIITASDMGQVISSGRGGKQVGRNTYMNKLIGEQINPGMSAGNYHDDDMDRGHMHEIPAIQMYQRHKDRLVKRNGFYTNHKKAFGLAVGYSPDGRVDDDPEGPGLIEIKSRVIHRHIDIALELESIPSDHMAQMQCGMWVSNRDWCDYIAVCEHLGAYIKRVYRDEDFIARMHKAVDDFYTDMLIKLEKLVAFQKTAPMMVFTSDDGYDGDIIDDFITGKGNFKNPLGG